jgi:hypothetical protein
MYFWCDKWQWRCHRGVMLPLLWQETVTAWGLWSRLCHRQPAIGLTLLIPITHDQEWNTATIDRRVMQEICTKGTWDIWQFSKQSMSHRHHEVKISTQGCPSSTNGLDLWGAELQSYWNKVISPHIRAVRVPWSLRKITSPLGLSW